MEKLFFVATGSICLYFGIIEFTDTVIDVAIPLTLIPFGTACFFHKKFMR